MFVRTLARVRKRMCVRNIVHVLVMCELSKRGLLCVRLCVRAFVILQASVHKLFMHT